MPGCWSSTASLGISHSRRPTRPRLTCIVRPDTWRWLQLREAVGTAVWTFAVDDETFEAQGLRMVRDALAAF
jgi:hypothetical protein